MTPLDTNNDQYRAAVENLTRVWAPAESSDAPEALAAAAPGPRCSPPTAVAVIRVLIADDHPVVRAGIRAILHAEPDIMLVGDAADGEAPVRAALEARPDVVVLDVRMPGGGGAVTAGEVARTCPGARVLAVSAHEEQGYVRQMLAAGAAGYVLKRSAATDLVRAVRAVAAGGTYIDPAVASAVASPALGPAADGAAELSDREAEVVRLIAKGYCNKEVAAKLALSVKTVETYKARSLEKLGVRTRVGLVRYAVERGWLGADVSEPLVLDAAAFLPSSVGPPTGRPPRPGP